MSTDDILAEAKKRLAECEAEADKLRRMIAAAEGLTAPVVPLPPITISGTRDWPVPFELNNWPTDLRVTCAPSTLHGSVTVHPDPDMEFLNKLGKTEQWQHIIAEQPAS